MLQRKRGVGGRYPRSWPAALAAVVLAQDVDHSLYMLRCLQSFNNQLLILQLKSNLPQLVTSLEKLHLLFFTSRY